ncbi:glycerol-3-phosphate 1-O-acyltransferase PlsB [Zhongshania aliphaticivorans]|uniref:glycerol-3-phosphate 1-O-acyltransferase PlsB n=1 Tax=Zhongshania aliphaticivorans TaxID=1470434 RepID=UPI00117C62AF|nr:glycerol-3-phosphate 1-O-acyltransferase PlsB [Zhongshania aliphaticivorans]
MTKDLSIMPWFTRLYFVLCRMLSAPFLAGVKPKLIQFDEALYDQLRGKPVCYVLRLHSWTDRFLLERIFKAHDLPLLRTSPGKLPDAGRASCLYLPVLAGQRGGSRGQQTMAGLIEQAAQGDYPLQIVPVSIFWGRNPGSETSFFKLLLGDGERAGALRKLLIIIAQRRNVLVHVAQPLTFDKFVARKKDPVAAAAMLARMMSFYFSRRATASLGPRSLSRQQIIDVVLRRQTVKDAIAAELNGPEDDVSAIKKKARKMAEEVAANYNDRMIRALELILSWVFRKIFSGLNIHHVERLRETANSQQLIYMPSHRSHFDYLLISYTLYVQGLLAPHIAAGVNLNFWPVGGMLRRGGAFYIRRSFSGQPLYTAVFQSYLDVILSRGYPVEFFPEGGRSRTGRLLPPKKGMLRMTVDSFIQQPGRSVALVPIYICYDKLVESASYVKELRGAAKQSESAGGLLKARKIFKSSYGSPHIAFGEPLSLDECFSHIEPNWRKLNQQGDQSFVPAVVDYIAQENMERINAAAVVNPIGLVSMILLSSPQRAMAEDELLLQIDHFIALLKRLPYSPDVTLPEGSAIEIFEQAARTAGLSRIEHPWGPIITATGKEAVMLTYYRNSVMHVLALPSLIARFFRHSQTVNEAELIQACVLLYPFVKQELFLRVSIADCAEAVAEQINNLVDLNLLSRNEAGGSLSRANVGTETYAVLTGLGRILRETFERYTVTSLLLVQEISDTPAPRKDIEQHTIEMAQRLAILSGREAPEYFDKNLFRVYMDTLIKQGLLVLEEGSDEELLRVDKRLESLSQRWVALLGPDVQQSMQQLIRKQTIQGS